MQTSRPKPLVRRARLRDLDGLVALYRELRPHDPVLSRLQVTRVLKRLLANNNTRLVVCEVGEILAATCMLGVVPSLAVGGRPFGIIKHVVTLPDFRRLGLARAVLEFALKLAWKRGCYKVMLLSGAQRPEAHQLYRAVGFRGGAEVAFVAKPASPPTPLPPP
ncbi:MAG: GNAT family N-acetyltransferase [Kiritimatiellaeota bacterium]|nr:GNAT family N-acetyltransferase [Kiritimatiellota bacterium]